MKAQVTRKRVILHKTSYRFIVERLVKPLPNFIFCYGMESLCGVQNEWRDLSPLHGFIGVVLWGWFDGVIEPLFEPNII